MKKYSPFLLLVIALVTIVSLHASRSWQQSVEGAWQRQDGTTRQVIIIQDGYFALTTYDLVNKKFIGTFGGSINPSSDEFHVHPEFDTKNKDRVGGHLHFPFQLLDKNKLKTSLGGQEQEWTRVDDGNSGLAGNWRITARMNNGQMQPMQRGARKTLKILSSTRFQWMAINPETKEFSGTGGGTYTFQNGKYTENIEFFSRDSSRVGAYLSFEGTVTGNIWTHKGLSSRGEPIHEEWTREK